MIKARGSNRAQARPRIALFLPSLAGGGAERVFLAVAGALARRPLTVDLLVASTGGELSDHVPEGVNLIDFRKKKALAAVPRLAAYLRHAKPEALLATILPANIAASIAVLLPGVQTRLILREANFPEYDTIGRRGIDTFLNRFMMRRLYPRADALVAMSAAMKSSIHAFHGSTDIPVTIIANPYLRAPSSSERAPAAVAQPPMILWAGRLEPQKDPLTAVRAFAKLRSRMVARLVMLGEGTLRKEVEELVLALGVGCDVELPGFVHEMPLWMQRCDVFLHTARWEGYANVLVEALASARPVVASDCPGAVREILDGGRLGALVPVADAERMASAMEAVLKGDLRFDDPQSLLKQLDIESIANQYLQLLIGRTDNPGSGSNLCAG